MYKLFLTARNDIEILSRRFNITLFPPIRVNSNWPNQQLDSPSEKLSESQTLEIA